MLRYSRQVLAGHSISESCILGCWYACCNIIQNCVNIQVAQICTHLAHTHFFVETFALGMHRCLMPSHPIHKMLKEHFRFIISIDTLGREVLIAPGGSADQSLTIGHGSDGVKKLLAKAYQRMDWDDFDYPKDLEKRGITKDLKGYHHKDDCVLLWGVIKSYVENMVKTFYENDLTVIKDWELQDWVKDVYENGFKDISSDSGKTALGLPWRLTTIDELVGLRFRLIFLTFPCQVTYLQRIIFTCTVRHTYANFYTYQSGQYYPFKNLLSLPVRTIFSFQKPHLWACTDLFMLLLMLNDKEEFPQVQSLCAEFSNCNEGKHPKGKGTGDNNSIFFICKFSSALQCLT